MSITERFRDAFRPVYLLAVLPLIAVAVRLPQLLDAAYRNADAPAVAILANAAREGHGPVTLPTQSDVGVFWLDQFLSGLPFGRVLIIADGPALAVIAILWLTAVSRSVYGERESWLTLAVAIVIPAVVLWTLLFPANHELALLGTIALAAQLVRVTRHSHPSLIPTVLLGAFAGLCLVSDPQLFVTGGIPYLICVACATRGRNRYAMRHHLITLGVLTLAVIGVIIVMQQTAVSVVNQLPTDHSPSQWLNGVGVVIRTVIRIGNDDWYSAPVTAASVLGILIGAGLVIRLVVLGVRAGRSVVDRSQMLEAWAMYRLFWLSSIVVLVGAFIFLGYGVNDISGHELSIAYFAVAALAPEIAGFASRKRPEPEPTWGPAPKPQPRWSSAAAITNAVLVPLFFALFAVHGLYANNSISADRFTLGVSSRSSGDPLPLLSQLGLHRGFAGRQVAYDLTWRSSGSVTVWPVLSAPAACTGPEGALCASAFSARGEYRPGSGPTFLITLNRMSMCIASQPPVDIFGAPMAAYQVGDKIISVYSYDISTRFTKRTAPSC